MKELELRMYFFVPYNISPIQQAIQAGHAALEYARLFKDDKQFIDFADNWKTWIILNGGTTNNTLSDDGSEYLGSLNNIKSEIIKYNFDHRKDKILNIVEYADFYEPDLNDALTAVCFITDERVFNYDDYPDLKPFIFNNCGNCENVLPMTFEEIKKEYNHFYIEWVETLGSGDFHTGEKNVFLRELLKGKKLA